MTPPDRDDGGRYPLDLVGTCAVAGYVLLSLAILVLVGFAG